MVDYFPRMMQIILMVLVLGLFLVPSSTAYNIDSIIVEDTLNSNLLTQEIVTIHLTNNTNEFFFFDVPSNAYDIHLGDVPIQENGLRIPLDCTTCTLHISYKLTDVIRDFPSDALAFYRTLNLPKNIKSITYTVTLPSQYAIIKIKDTDSLPIVPIPTKIEPKTSGTTITWSEKNPELPKVFQITFKDHEEIESETQEFVDEFSEGYVWLLSMISALLGAILGIGIYKQFNTIKERTSYVPSSLLSPDEKKVVALLQKNNNKMDQTQIGKHLHWSKSKVSAIITNLHYKKLIEKEKFGRKYTVTLIKKID